jgi:DNA-binding HxlR family transcriptional regulator
MARYPKNLAPALDRINSPLAGVLTVMSARWGPLVLEALADGYVRFNELHRYLTGVNHKVLIETLRMLERGGFVRKVPVAGQAGSQVVAEYWLTDVGSELLGWINEVRDWAERRAADR